MATPSVTLTGKLETIAGANDPGQVVITLVGFNDTPPRISGTMLLSEIQQTVTAASDGTFSITLWGNYQLTPAGTAYQIAIYPSSSTTAPTVVAEYQFNAAGSYDISTVTPINNFVPPNPFPAGGIWSVFGRTGAVTSAIGDYDVSQVTNAADARNFPINVKLYGAMGNGTTDDTAAIQAAITAAAAAPHGAMVYFPAGTYIISPPTTSYVFNVASGSIHFCGEGVGLSILKIKNSVGDYSVVFGPTANNVSNLTFSRLSFNQNSTGNPLTSAANILTYPRSFVVVNVNQTNLTIEDCEFTDVNSEDLLVSYAIETICRNCRFSGVGGGTVYHDSSLLYFNCENSIIEGNIFISNGPGSAGAVTAIETHAGKQTIIGNSIDGFATGMNITGISLSDSDSIVVTGNSINRGFIGIDIWSYQEGSHTTGFGINGLVVSDNSIVINQTLHTVEAGSGVAQANSPLGIFIDPNSNLPLKNVSITGNMVVFDLESSSSAPYNDSGIGIGYWDATNTNSISGLNISNNTIINFPVTAIRLSVKMSDVLVGGNLIVNPGSSVSSSASAFFANGILLAAPTTAAKDIRVLNNVITDNLSTSRMVRGVYLGNPSGSDVTLVGNVFTVSGATTTSFLYAIDPNSTSQLPYARNTQVLPAVGSVISFYNFAQGSTLTDASTGKTWSVIANGTTWVSSAIPIAKPTVTGSKGGNAALASLMTALSNLGLVTDSTT